MHSMTVLVAGKDYRSCAVAFPAVAFPKGPPQSSPPEARLPNRWNPSADKVSIQTIPEIRRISETSSSSAALWSVQPVEWPESARRDFSRRSGRCYFPFPASVSGGSNAAGVPADILRFCRAELVADNYFHAVLEATRSIADKLRAKSGLTDGAKLVDAALCGVTPRVRINALMTDSQRSEQSGFIGHADIPTTARFAFQHQNPPKVTLPIALPLSTSAWAFFRFAALIGLNVCV